MYENIYIYLYAGIYYIGTPLHYTDIQTMLIDVSFLELMPNIKM